MVPFSDPINLVDDDLKSRTRTFLCISFGWILLVCYSILLTGAAESIIGNTGIVIPDENTKQIVIFIYGLAVVSFLGGSQIPAVFLKKRSFVIQFGFSATFGLMLLLLNMLNNTILGQISEPIKTLFLSYPVVAIEYLSIPYLFMIFIDLHLDGRLDAFSWRRFGRFLKGTFPHPRETFEEVICSRSILFSLVSVVLVSVVWTVRTAAFAFSGFVPVRWRLLPFNIVELEPVSRVLLIVPTAIILWLTISVLIHVVVQRFGGTGGFSEIGSLLGFAFLPSLITIAVDILEMKLQIGDSLAPNMFFLISGFIIPLALWPLILATFAVQKSEDVGLLGATLIAVALFLPLYVFLVQVFL